MTNQKDTKEKYNASAQLEEFVAKRKKPLVGIVVAVVVIIAIYGIAVTVNSKSTEKGLTAIDTITYELTNDSTYLEDDELEARRGNAMEAVSEYLSKGGIVGVRANMLAADIAFARKDFEEALGYWQQAASKGSGAYTAPLAYYNIGVCHEELGNFSAAAESYERAANVADFAFAAHARFSAGRTKEADGDYAGAYGTYQKLVDAYPNDTWANLAKSRQISLRVEGKASR